MSDYKREKVLRIPLAEIKLRIWEEDPGHDVDDLEFEQPDIWGYAEPGKFQLPPTNENYIDFVLEVDRDCCGDWGKVRKLYDSEKEKYLPVFKKIAAHPNMGAVRLVEFCWYDGVEAPDYYGVVNDPFYNEV